ncbi:MAG TPA: right-handed parallel beta-helix repeat-containing protein [Gemmataceae bacterium]|nr:right-handed parallel beta-helix repeat-containing protein [Gemmataceae bacterium]
MDDIWSLFSRRPAAQRRAPKGTSRRLHLEQLEERIAPSADPVLDVTTGKGYTTIQAAIDAANNGDIITVAPGTYNESVYLNKSVTLEGAQYGVAGSSSSRTNPANESIVDNDDTPFQVAASNVTIDGFAIEGSATQNNGGFGVFIGNNVSGTHVLDNIIDNNIIGLGLANTGASQAVVQDNLFLDNNNPGASSGTAIYSDQNVSGGALKNVLIDHNAFLDNQNAGIELSSTDPSEGASDITITNNVFDSNAQDLFLNNTTDATIANNSILSTISPASDGAGSAAIGLYGNDNNISILNNVLQNGTAYGIRIGDFNTGPSSNIAITDNSIAGFAAAGLRLDPGGYSGTLNATGNYWGAATGPTSPNNPGGTGSVLDDAASQVVFAPWLSSDANSAPSGQPGFVGDSASLISSNSSSSGSTATRADLQQQVFSDLSLALQLQSSGLDQAQQQFGTWFYLAYSQSPPNAVSLVLDEIELTAETIMALEETMLGMSNTALLGNLAGLESAISDNPLTPTQAGQQLLSLTGALVVAELL